MVLLKLVGFLRFWRRRDNDVHTNEASPLIPKGDDDPERAAAVGPTEPEEGYDGKAGAGSDSSGELAERGRVWGDASPCDHLLKTLLFFSNLLFSVLGLVTLSLGLWGLVDKESFAQEKIGYIGTDPMLVFVSLGLALSLLCLSGCVGTLRENYCLLRAFSAGVLVLVTAQVLAAIVVYTLRGEVKSYLRSGMLVAMARYQNDLDLRFIMDEIQTGLQCCGADTYRDWDINVYFNCSAPGVQACGVPASCCLDPLENGTVWNSQCGVGARRLDELSAQAVVFLGGCLGGMARWVERHSAAIATAGVAVLGVQILSVFISTRLLDDIRRRKSLRR
ncbi:tetraspanin-10 [Megalops cyprinoides]|uniref:tetraspanin-10 n=1 Tax=Megalops cyprinoides TaxID=118141 RepID=UPI001863F263|nr:tetraspanin-10 [Megalops cyprinoides]